MWVWWESRNPAYNTALAGLWEQCSIWWNLWWTENLSWLEVSCRLFHPSEMSWEPLQAPLILLLVPRAVHWGSSAVLPGHWCALGGLNIWFRLVLSISSWCNTLMESQQGLWLLRTVKRKSAAGASQPVTDTLVTVTKFSKVFALWLIFLLFFSFQCLGWGIWPHSSGSRLIQKYG